MDKLEEFKNRKAGLDITAYDDYELKELSALIDVPENWMTLYEYVKDSPDWELVVWEPVHLPDGTGSMFNAYRGNSAGDFGEYHPIYSVSEMLDKPKLIDLSMDDIESLFEKG